MNTIADKILLFLTRNCPIRFIDIDGKDYLERCYVGQLFGWTFYLHRFVSADSERRLHNHPWRKSFGLVLTGNYVEEQLERLCCFKGVVTKKRKIRWFNWITHKTFHRIVKPKPFSWTLFAHGKRFDPSGWGFIGNQKSYTVEFHPTDKEKDKVINATVEFYQPFDTSAVTEWWLTAPKAKEVKRVNND